MDRVQVLRARVLCMLPVFHNNTCKRRPLHCGISTGPMSAQGHVWTAPAGQGFFGFQLAVGCKSCVRPVCAVLMTAGPDVIRRSGPNQTLARDSARPSSGFSRFPVQPVRIMPSSPSTYIGRSRRDLTFPRQGHYVLIATAPLVVCADAR